MSDSLVADVTRLVESHPAIAQSGERHPAHCNLYVSKSGHPIATEPERVRVANIWVRADSVIPSTLADCPSVYYDCSRFDESKPNHNLFREPGFKDVDLIRYQPVDIWQAIRVISAVVGDGK